MGEFPLASALAGLAESATDGCMSEKDSFRIDSSLQEYARFGLGVLLKHLDMIGTLTIHPLLEATCGKRIGQIGRSTAEVES